MLAIIDSRAPDETIEKLKLLCDDVFCFISEGITYNSIAGHPDIFIYQDNQGIVVAPNAPKSLIEFLRRHDIDFEFGASNVGSTLKESTSYNCVSSDNRLFHKSGFTDSKILARNESKPLVSLPQAYTRCSMIEVAENAFLTSDKGIEKVLLQLGLECFYFSPEEIHIIDHKNGFVGGTCGIYKGKLFFMGNIDKHVDGKGLRAYLKTHHVQFECLSDDFLYDGGGLFFLQRDME